MIRKMEFATVEFRWSYSKSIIVHKSALSIHFGVFKRMFEADAEVDEIDMDVLCPSTERGHLLKLLSWIGQSSCGDMGVDCHRVWSRIYHALIAKH